MILAIDIGNTHILSGCMEGETLRQLSRIESALLRTDDEYAVLLERILAFDGIDRSCMEGAIISSVVPSLTGTLRSAVKKLTGKTALVVGAGIKTGLNIMIDDPGQLGSDLVANAVAAVAGYTMPAIVIDMGTATTLTVIDRSLRLLGGAILPGVRLSLGALSGGASQLPAVSVEAPRRCIGTNTADCMKSGAVYGAAACLDGLVARMEEQLGEPCTVIVTGDIAPVVLPCCRREMRFDANLSLRGLSIIYEKNRK